MYSLSCRRAQLTVIYITISRRAEPVGFGLKFHKGRDRSIGPQKPARLLGKLDAFLAVLLHATVFFKDYPEPRSLRVFFNFTILRGFAVFEEFLKPPPSPEFSNFELQNPGLRIHRLTKLIQTSVRASERAVTEFSSSFNLIIARGMPDGCVYSSLLNSAKSMARTDYQRCKNNYDTREAEKLIQQIKEMRVSHS